MPNAKAGEAIKYLNREGDPRRFSKVLGIDSSMNSLN
jgi:hypothetical protein